MQTPEYVWVQGFELYVPDIAWWLSRSGRAQYRAQYAIDPNPGTAANPVMFAVIRAATC